MRCKNKVEYWYAEKLRETTCGSTGPWGDAMMCQSCEDKIETGKMNRPGYCKHGTPLMDPTDSYDITCVYCEME